jgi:signal transduction histidine kinase
LLTMRGCAREALAELRVALHALRGDQHPEAGTLPQPRLAQLAGLTAQAESAGIRVHLSQPGADTPMPVDRSLPPVLELTAYRIVQEALTNAVRHSGAGNLWVQLCRDGTHLIVDVSDDGRGLPSGPGAPGEGLGLRGMRERAESLGGTLHCGPSGRGGCRILARLPL